MILTHLLPRARAWRVTIDKQLKHFLASFGSQETDAKAFLDDVYLDLLPATTRQLTQWEKQFNLPQLGISDADRRVRLAATWAAVGGQSPKYIQDTLQAAGFPVYVHEWWVPGTTTARNPLTYLQQTYPGFVAGVQCDDGTAGSVTPHFAQCGEVWAECGNQVAPLGYPLVNKVPDTPHVVPGTGWQYFLYIGGEVFGTLAQVDPIRRNEFETLCLKICPAHLWLGILVEY